MSSNARACPLIHRIGSGNPPNVWDPHTLGCVPGKKNAILGWTYQPNLMVMTNMWSTARRFFPRAMPSCDTFHGRSTNCPKTAMFLRLADFAGVRLPQMLDGKQYEPMTVGCKRGSSSSVWAPRPPWGGCIFLCLYARACTKINEKKRGAVGKGHVFPTCQKERRGPTTMCIFSTRRKNGSRAQKIGSTQHWICSSGSTSSGRRDGNP